MLLNNTYDPSPYEQASAVNTDYETIMEDPSRHMTFSKMIRRQFRDSYSPGAHGRRSAATARIMKPTSAGNSPSRVDRRRTMMPESTSRTRPTLYDHFENMFNVTGSRDRDQHQSTAPRPVSWQPTSRRDNWLQAQQLPENVMQVPVDYRLATGAFGSMCLEEPRTPSLFPCSDPISPATPIPTLGTPFNFYGQHIYGLSDTGYPSQAEYMHNTTYPAEAPSGPVQMQAAPVVADCPFDQYLSLVNSQQDWSQFVYGSGAFFPSTPPQTDDVLMSTQYSLFPAEDEVTRPSAPNMEPQGSSKELVGMGLYDAPDTSTPALEPDDYRNSMISTMSYLDHDFPGKGLKLEETWKPAESDDEEEDSESTDESQTGPSNSEDYEEESAHDESKDKSVILFDDGSFDGEVYVSASPFMAQPKAQGAKLRNLSWI